VPGDPRIRAADADRDRAAALLREHHAAGRLTAEEFHDRMEKAMDARTMGELDDLMADLPAIDLYQLPDAALRRAKPRTGQSLLPSDYLSGRQDVTAGPGSREVEGMSPEATAVVAWTMVATVLVVIGLITAVLVGAVVSAWAFATVPLAIAWIWFLIRRSQR
jgi:hypothetical protein